MKFRSVQFSRTQFTELMVPSFANFGGKIHGGIILSLMDKVAYAVASKHAGTYCVTVSADGIDFLQPVEVGELLTLDAAVHYVANSSLVVGIKVTSEDIKTNKIKHTNNSYFTMVAKNQGGKPVQVPGLILEDITELRRFVEAVKRRAVKQEAKIKLQQEQEEFIMVDELEMLNNQRCRLEFKVDDNSLKF